MSRTVSFSNGSMPNTGKDFRVMFLLYLLVLVEGAVGAQPQWYHRRLDGCGDPTTVDNNCAGVEMLGLKADLSVVDMILGIGELPGCTNCNVSVRHYQQEVTLKSTLRNFTGDLQDATWKDDVLGSAASMALEGTTWRWLGDGIESIVSTVVTIEFVMTWTLDRAQSSSYMNTATGMLTGSDFDARFATEIATRGLIAYPSAATTVPTAVDTTVSFVFVLCCPLACLLVRLLARCLCRWLIEA